MISEYLVSSRIAVASLAATVVLGAVAPCVALEGCFFERGSRSVARIGPVAVSGRLIVTLQRGGLDTRPGARFYVLSPWGIGDAGRWDAIWRVQDVALNADTVLVAADNGLVTIDLDDPRYPRELDFIDLTGGEHLAIQGDLAYLASNFYGGRAWFTVVDISEPSDLQERNALLWTSPDPVEPCWSMNSIDVSGEFAVISLSCGAIVVDVSDPWHPTKRGEWYRSGVMDVTLIEDIAAMAIDRSGGGPNDIGVEFVDLSDPDQPSSAGFWAAPSAVRSVAEYGGGIVVGTEEDGIVLLDIGDPAQPIVLEHWTSNDLSVESLATAWPTIAFTDTASRAVVLGVDPSCMPPRLSSGRVGP
jgi:hypothetical protein